MRKYITSIGLEVHIQVKSKNKLFSSSPVEFGADPNSNVCAFDLAIPGILPMLNWEPVEKAIQMSTILKGNINKECSFDRKHYRYPDLPLGYQITQFYNPIMTNGYFEFFINGERNKIRIKQMHMETDAGKLNHFGNLSAVDYNRQGICLLEIVTEPDFHSEVEVSAFLDELINTARFYNISDCNLEKGNVRADVNISNSLDKDVLGTRCEIKNMNSLKFIREAIQVESERQIELIERGFSIHCCTLGYDQEKKRTYVTRSKEDAIDYRYIRDPNIPQLNITQEDIEKNTISNLPTDRIDKYVKAGVPFNDSVILTRDMALCKLYDYIVKESGNITMATNILIHELRTLYDIEDLLNYKDRIVEIIKLLVDQSINIKSGRILIKEHIKSQEDINDIIIKYNMKQVSDVKIITNLCHRAIKENQGDINSYIGGNEKAINRVIGWAIKEEKQVNPDLLRKIMIEILKI